jgi:DNA-binding GntR family transcriptional regulator
MAPRRVDPAAPAARAPVHLTKAELARQHIRGLILTGEVRAGERLTSREVCEALGMSETPVREALRSLSAEGWLDMHPHLGVVVAGADPNNLAELYLIGGMLGALAIELGAAAFDAAHLDRLDRILDQSEQATAAGDTRAYGQLNRKFHATLCDTPHSVWTRKVLTGLIDKTEAATQGFGPVPDRLAASLAEHRAIVAALRQGDFAKAGALVRAHETRAGEAMLAAMRRGQ